MAKVNVYKDLDLREAVEILREGIKSKKNIYVIAKCDVEYFGRSSSKLEEGERQIIIKSDGAFLIHRPTGHSPVNWQPETSYIDVSFDEEEEKVIIKAIRAKPRETVIVRVSEIPLIITSILYDYGAFYMHVSEREIRDVLASNPSLLGEDLVTIDIEKKVEPGFIDLYLRDKRGNVVVVEIKRLTARVDAVRQLKKYIEALKKHMGSERIRGIIAAPSITSKANELLLKEKLEFKQINLKVILEYAKKKAERRGILEFLGKGKT